MSNSSFPTTPASEEDRQTVQPSDSALPKDQIESILKSMKDYDLEIYETLSKFGRPIRKSKKLLNGLREMREAILGAGPMVLLSPKEKAFQLKQWDQKLLYEVMAAKGMSKDELDPIYVDDLVYEALVLYRESDKSFWKWELFFEGDHEGSGKLTKVCHYWVDIFLKGAWLSSDSYFCRDLERKKIARRAKRREERYDEMSKLMSEVKLEHSSEPTA